MKFTGTLREPEKMTAQFSVLKLPLSGGYEEGYADGRTAGIAEGEQTATAQAEAANAIILTDCNAVLQDKGVETADTLEQVPQRIGEIPSYDDGYKDGGNGVLSYATSIPYLFSGATFTDGAGLELYVPNFNGGIDYLARDTTGLKKLVLRCDNTDGIMSVQQAFINSSVEILDISQWKRKLGNTTHFASTSKLTKIIGAFDLSETTSTYLFVSSAGNLVDIAFVSGTIFVDISFSGCSKLSDASIQSIIDGLADLTGQTAQTLTFHKTVGNKLTDAQKATITAKNWTLAY